MISSHCSTPRRPRRGFTLTELLVIFSIVAVLVLLVMQVSSRMKEKVRWVKDVGNLKVIGSAILARANDNNDVIYWKREIGNSSYREFDDPLGLPTVLKDFVSGEDVWMSPGAHERLKEFKNGYAWTRAGNLTDYDSKTGAAPLTANVERPAKTPLLWNAFNYTLPSVRSVAEGTNGGPRAAPSSYQYKPWDWGTKKSMLMMDLHVEKN